MNWDYKELYNLSTEKCAQLHYHNAWMKACLSELKSILDSEFIESNEFIMNRLKWIANGAENVEKDYNELMVKIQANASCNDI